MASPRLASIVEGVLDFLVGEAIPHLRAEQEILYPALQRALGRPDATAALEAEHAEVRIQTERLGSLAQHLAGAPAGRSERHAVERELTRLHRLLHGHVVREAGLCSEARAALPALDAGWESLSRAMEEAEQRALGSVVLVAQPAVSSQAAIVMRHNPTATRAYAMTLADLHREREPRARSGEEQSRAGESREPRSS